MFVDDRIIEIHGYAKQGIEYGYSGGRGLNALPARSPALNVVGEHGSVEQQDVE